MQIVISGYGKMGHIIERIAKEQGIKIALISEEIATVAALPRNDGGCRNDNGLKDCVCIDFTTPSAFKANYQFLAKNFKSVVVGTTGWYDIKEEVFKTFMEEKTTLIWASNFSIGVNAFFAAIQKASEVLKDNGYSANVEEIHHIHKLDAPSGTAKSIASIIEKYMPKPEIISKRIGEVPGTHIATLSSKCDKLTFSHEAFSREGFAQGAILAAKLSEKLTGIYEFKDIIL